MKRRIRLKPRFWVIVALFTIVGIVCGGNLKAEEEAIVLSYSEASAEPIAIELVAEATAEQDYLLDIPLSCELQGQLYDACQEFGVEYYTMVALIRRETNFRNVMGDYGRSYGYCQIQPRWWSGLMAEIGAKNLLVPKDNFRTACAIMAQLLNRYKSVEGALVAYNKGAYYGSSTNYSREIMANAEYYRQEKRRSHSANMETASEKIYKTM